jgi:phosphonate transport system ATP-binding protein
MIRFEQASVTYPGGVTALEGFDLKISEGEFVVVVGLSGAGKSTLIRTVNGLVPLTSGRVVVAGRDVTRLRKRQLRSLRADVGMIFQHFNLVKRSSVLTNVLTGRLGYTPPAWSLINRFSRADRDRAAQALERVGIPDKARNRADELSGGQQQRVGIARALMQQPKMILADEPVASLDPVLAHSILGSLEKINKEDNVTILCSLHFLDLVQRYATRVIGLREGQIVFQGDSEDIRQLTDEEFKDIYGEEAERLGA